MKKIFRYFFPTNDKENIKNTQTANVSGNNNEIHQTINNNYFFPDDNESTKAIIPTSETSPVNANASPIPERARAQDPDAIKKILEYRQIATNGDCRTSLTLLHNLESEEGYQSGYAAFRLHFNIGMVEYLTGELDNASRSFRQAHRHYPNDPKSETGLAFADYIDGHHLAAMERAKVLRLQKGDHQSLALTIELHSSSALNQQTEIQPSVIEEFDSADVRSAYLEYLRTVKPDEYPDALNQALDANPSDPHIATLWALSILENAEQNQAFLLGARMPTEFEENVRKCAEILHRSLNENLRQNPPNRRTLPSQANNAILSLRLSGQPREAAKVADKVIDLFPELREHLAELRTCLFLQEGKDNEAFELAASLSKNERLQVLASEIEAKLGWHNNSFKRLNHLLNTSTSSKTRQLALLAKAQIAINSLSLDAADEALEDIEAEFAASPERLLLKSAYERAFSANLTDASAQPDTEGRDRELLSSIENADSWEFGNVLQAANELIARGHYRSCADFLKDRISYSTESPALSTLCEACVLGQLGSLGKEIIRNLPRSVQVSVFGKRFEARIHYISGDISKAIPLLRQLFQENKTALQPLHQYIQALLRTNSKPKVKRLVLSLDDKQLNGTLEEKCEYVRLLVFCGATERARNYAYALYCKHQNDHKTWMALSASVLALGQAGPEDSLQHNEIAPDVEFQVRKPSGEVQTFRIESEVELLPLREGNIPVDHPLSISALGKKAGDVIIWPFNGSKEEAEVLSVKHKVLAAFHRITERFEEQFPDNKSFKSVSIDPNGEDALAEMKLMLKERADYAHLKSQEYHEGSYPLAILAHHLGLDPIDAMLGLKAECAISPKVSSCTTIDQEHASLYLDQAKERGTLLDAPACYLLRRLGIEEAFTSTFGRIGVTQNTIDVFVQRLQEAENSGFFDRDEGEKKTASVSFRNGQLLLSEQSEKEVTEKIKLLRSDLEWLQSSCELIPATAKSDPDEAVIKFRTIQGGGFIDDLFAADGSYRILISDDFHLRQWGQAIFGISSAWMQAVLFYLQSAEKISLEKLTEGTILLCSIGQQFLSVNPQCIVTAAELWSEGKISQWEFETIATTIGQRGANMDTHIPIAALTIEAIWVNKSLRSVRMRAASILLYSITRLQDANSLIVLNRIQRLVTWEEIQTYISQWRRGHFFE
ncbi:PIN domain-containing protein [Owenweeksia hongkongensis]|uniref:PIN domain-containing protein n=1 Tax=Owenweeksia hongkongensis TaxID=253245 RepID=UPI003A8DB8D7